MCVYIYIYIYIYLFIYIYYFIFKKIFLILQKPLLQMHNFQYFFWGSILWLVAKVVMIHYLRKKISIKFGYNLNMKVFIYYLYIYIPAHTHTHTYIYISIYDVFGYALEFMYRNLAIFFYIKFWLNFWLLRKAQKSGTWF
jgi:hypothetical protein